jgi:hypothetical protein
MRDDSENAQPQPDVNLSQDRRADCRPASIVVSPSLSLRSLHCSTGQDRTNAREQRIRTQRPWLPCNTRFRVIRRRKAIYYDDPEEPTVVMELKLPK